MVAYLFCIPAFFFGMSFGVYLGALTQHFKRRREFLLRDQASRLFETMQSRWECMTPMEQRRYLELCGETGKPALVEVVGVDERGRPHPRWCGR